MNVTTEGSQLECTLPPGVGATISVYLVITLGGLGEIRQETSPQSLLGYADPSIYSLSVVPSVCTPLANNVLQLLDCPNEESAPPAVLTLNGTDFGESGAVVLVGGRPCSSLNHSIPHARFLMYMIVICLHLTRLPPPTLTYLETHIVYLQTRVQSSWRCGC